MYSTEIMKFIYWEQASRDTIDFKKTYVDLAEDLIAGLLLSQIVYWYLPSKETGKTKLRVKKEGHYWIAKGRNDWWDEIRITGKQFDRASNILVKKELIEKKTFKFNGSPTVHIRLLWENFLPRLENIIYNEDSENNEGTEDESLSDMVIPQRVKSKLPKGEKRNYPKGKMEIDQKGKSLTKNTTENTTKIDTKTNNVSIVNKEELKNICNQYYAELSIGRWTKEQWHILIDRFLDELVKDKRLDSIKDINTYIKNSLENIAYKHDKKYGKLNIEDIFDVPENNRDTSVYYNWLDD